VQTVAGNGTYGYADGPAASAEFAHPQGLAIDAAGNLYVVDSENYRIRKIDTQGNVTTLAGNGSPTEADGTGGPNGTAGFNYPKSIAVNAAGTALYVTDAQGLRQLDASGNTTTLSTATGYLAVDSAGNLYLAGPGGLQTVDAQGTATVIPAAAGYSASLVAVDAAGDVFFYGSNGTTGGLFEIDASGTLSTRLPVPSPGASFGSAELNLSAPEALAIDAAGDVYIADTGNADVRVVDPQGNLSTLVGNAAAGDVDGTGGPRGTTEFGGPVGVVVDASGAIDVLDEGNNQVRQVDICNGATPATIDLCSICGCTVLATGQSYATSIAVDAQNVYWSSAGTAANGYLDGAILAMPLGGGAIVTLASNQQYAGPLVVSAGTVYWTTQVSGCTSTTSCPANSGLIQSVPGIPRTPTGSTPGRASSRPP
jgi:hypothetical protein